ncbi:hypothetical protein H0H81_003536 [Sphagnurus paluster]|uniref:Uncharacterized protein n=1 Tax=Sphagnurus paluster TaxID=117069 RepID=A0A9P7GP16_9AGAR|nr:hypothetical protein H0H81_003536 [Sphagnurus paluster]
MMFALTILCLSFILSLVHASPLSARDVFSPQITSPNANTIWPVGTKQMVTWETDKIPPDSQLTNPNGRVVLGHLGPTGGLNLQLDNPLAQNFKLRVGQVQITVPSVTPRDDYIIVLFGDSGNASPAFAITRITGGLELNSTSSSNTSRPATTSTSSSATSVPTPITEPIPITGTTITGGESSTTEDSSSSSSSSTPESTPTVPASSSSATSGSTPTTPASSSSSGAGTSAPATSTNNAAWPAYHLSSLSCVGVASLVLALLI